MELLDFPADPCSEVRFPFGVPPIGRDRGGFRWELPPPRTQCRKGTYSFRVFWLLVKNKIVVSCFFVDRVAQTVVVFD